MVAEDRDAIAFLDIRPVTPAHTLVISRRHAELVGGLSRDEWIAVAALAQRVQAAIRDAKATRCDAMNLYVADGETAGQEVPHVHMHVVPRFSGDGFGLRLPPGYGRIAERAELDATAERIRTSMS